MQLRNRVVVVTGAGRGLGRCIAVELGRKGAKIAAVDVNDQAETARLVTEAGGECHVFTADVAREDAVASAFDAVVARFGVVHGLVNNAGITRDGQLVRARDGEISTMSLRQW